MRNNGNSVLDVKKPQTRHSHFASTSTRVARGVRAVRHVHKRASAETTAIFHSNTKHATTIWGDLSASVLQCLKEISERHSLSVAAGELLILDGRWYVTHSGLLRIAQRNRCAGIKSVLVERLSDISASRWIFKATVYKARDSKGFVGYGDADPSNVSSLVRGAEMRIAETRAVNRALRKAYGIGLCSVEELGSFSAPMTAKSPTQGIPVSRKGNGSNHSQPRLRDQLSLLIRRFNLDPTLVKAYAADFCGTATLRDASRDLIESFISHLATAAEEDRDALVCKLNSHAQPAEAKP